MTLRDPAPECTGMPADPRDREHVLAILRGVDHPVTSLQVEEWSGMSRPDTIKTLVHLKQAGLATCELRGPRQTRTGVHRYTLPPLWRAVKE